MRLLVLSCVLALAACGGSGPPSPGADATPPEDAVMQVGDLTMRASVVETMSLSAEIARRYGISRSEDTVLLLVAVRKGDEATAVSVPATVSATATDLRGGKQQIQMREIRSGSGADALIDSIGIATVTPPETMRFDIAIVHAGGRTSMAMSREFYPR